MKPRNYAIVAVLLVFAGVWGLKHGIESQHRKTREAQYQAKLASYAYDFKPGTTRATVDSSLHTRGITMFQLNNGEADFIKIGQEEAQWFCNRTDIDIRINFRHATSVNEPASADQVKSVELWPWLQDCL